jgi:hypothetical protein
MGAGKTVPVNARRTRIAVNKRRKEAGMLGEEGGKGE